MNASSTSPLLWSCHRELAVLAFRVVAPSFDSRRAAAAGLPGSFDRIFVAAGAGGNKSAGTGGELHPIRHRRPSNKTRIDITISAGGTALRSILPKSRQGGSMWQPVHPADNRLLDLPHALLA
jgi:hypothetical protein